MGKIFSRRRKILNTRVDMQTVTNSITAKVGIITYLSNMGGGGNNRMFSIRSLVQKVVIAAQGTV